MLVAMGDDGFQRFASATKRTEEVFCPVCKEKVMLKAGRVVVQHFAHFPDSHCTYGQGESLAHMLMKESIHRWLTQWGVNVELEVPVLDPDRRADLMVTTDKGNRFVIECQVSPISIDEWEERNDDYASHGIPVTWVWSSARINTSAGRDDEAKFPAEIRHQIESHPYEVVHVFDAIESQLVHLFTATPEERDPDEDDWWHDGPYVPKTLRKVESRQAVLPVPTLPWRVAVHPFRMVFQPMHLHTGTTTIDLDWIQVKATPEVQALIDAFSSKEGVATRAA